MEISPRRLRDTGHGVGGVFDGGTGVGVSVGAVVGVSLGTGVLVGVSVDTVVGVSVGVAVGELVAVAVDVVVGVNVFDGHGGTYNLCPTRMIVVFRQLASCSSGTVMLYNWLMLYKVSPGFTM